MSDKKAQKQEGWLKKRGDKGIVKGWKNRFFILEADPDKLYYYRSRGDPKPLGCIELSKVFSIQRTNDGAFGFAVCVPGRIYYLQAFSEGERTKWLDYFAEQTKLPIGDENTKPSTKKPKDPNAPDESSSEEAKSDEKVKKKDKKKDSPSSSTNVNTAPNSNLTSSTSDTTVANKDKKEENTLHKSSSGSDNNNKLSAAPEGSSNSRTNSLDANAASAETASADSQRDKPSPAVDSYNSTTVASPDPLLVKSVEGLDLSKEDSFSSFTFRPASDAAPSTSTTTTDNQSASTN